MSSAIKPEPESGGYPNSDCWRWLASAWPPSIELGSLVACPYCKGKGLTPSTETLAVRFLRQLKTLTRKSGLQRVHGSVPKAVADYVLNKKRKEITELEMQRGFALTIEGDDNMPPHECHIDCDPHC